MNIEGALDEGGKVAVTITKQAEAAVTDKKKQRTQDEVAAIMTGEPVKPIHWHQLFRTADALDYLLIFLGTIGGMGSGIMLPLFSILFGNFSNIFGNYVPECLGIGTPPGMIGSDEFRRQVNAIALQFLWLSLGAYAAGFLQQAAWVWSGNRQTNRLRSHFLRAVLRQEIAFFDTQATTGGLLQGLNEDSIAVQQGISEKVGVFQQHATTFIVGYVIAFVKGWDMTLVMVGCLPFLAVAAFLLQRVTTTLTNQAQVAYTEAGAIVHQSVSQMRTVAAYNGEERAKSQYASKLDMPAAVGKKQGLIAGLSLGAMQFVMFCSYAVALFYGAFRVAAGAYTGGQVLNVLIASLLGSFSLGLAAPNLQHFSKATSAGARMWQVINRKPKIDPECDGAEPESVVGQLELRDVTFAYPARPDVMVFSNFNLTVPAGKTVALVGSSGSGKSTVVGLIERFYDPLSGTVLLDGVDIRTLKLSWLRQQVGLVSQEPTLFGTTIYENIAMGREGATRAEVEEASKAANAYKFISMLPLGFETKVGERGIALSGGQKQRIAIARAILKNPKVLLLDEATSALDSESERIVQNALDKMIVGRTTVVVAHRLSTIKNADIISVVRQGVIVEQGNHDELLKDPTGAYTTLVQLQLQAHQGEEAGPATVEEAEEAELHAMMEHGNAENGDAVIDVNGNGTAAHGRMNSLELARNGSLGSPTGSSKRGISFELKRVVVDGHKGKDAEAPGSSEGAAAKGKGGKKKKGDEEDEGEKVVVPFSRLLGLNKQEWPYGIVGCLSSAGVGAVQPAFAFVISSMITIFYISNPDELKREAAKYSWYFFAVACATFVCYAGQQWAFGVMAQELGRRVRIMLFGSILKQEIGWFDLDANSSGRLGTVLSADATHLRGAVADVFGLLLQNMATLAVGYVIAFIFEWRVALLITGLLPLIAGGAFLNIKFNFAGTNATEGVYGEANSTVSEALSAMRIIAAYNLNARITGLYSKLLDGANVVLRKNAVVAGLAFGFSMFMMFSLYAIVIWFGGLELSSCRASYGDFLKAFLCILLAAMGLAQAQMSFPDLGKAKSAVQRVFRILDRKPAIDSSSPDGLQPDTPVRGELELRDVVFAYPTRPSVVLFNGFSLSIPAGKQVALVGESGSGKSTVVGLIERFYDPLSGTVLLDGVDIKQYNIQWLRKQIALVSQEPLLFATTIGENIRYGRPDATHEQMIEAAKAANAHDFIMGLPQGYDTQVGERGVQLSGGQKQRVAIARAVVKDPKVLLLDEATSALDAHAERVVQDALDRIMVGRTSVVVAHRLSTIRNADVIAVVFRGQILEKGTHDELMAVPGGGYAKLVANQMKTSRSTPNLAATGGQ